MAVTGKGREPLRSGWYHTTAGRRGAQRDTSVRKSIRVGTDGVAYKAIWSDFFFSAAAAGSAALTGTITSSINESDIVTGGKTLIITLTGDTWVASGATFDAQRQNIINGIDSAQSEANGWDAVVKALQGVAGVVRTSDTVVTITFSAQASYNITAQETITVTVPATALTLAGAIIATPTFTIATYTPVSNTNQGMMLMGIGG